MKNDRSPKARLACKIRSPALALPKNNYQTHLIINAPSMSSSQPFRGQADRAPSMIPFTHPSIPRGHPDRAPIPRRSQNHQAPVGVVAHASQPARAIQKPCRQPPPRPTTKATLAAPATATPTGHPSRAFGSAGRSCSPTQRRTALRPIAPYKNPHRPGTHPAPSARRGNPHPIPPHNPSRHFVV